MLDSALVYGQRVGPIIFKSGFLFKNEDVQLPFIQRRLVNRQPGNLQIKISVVSNGKRIYNNVLLRSRLKGCINCVLHK